MARASAERRALPLSAASAPADVASRTQAVASIAGSRPGRAEAAIAWAVSLVYFRKFGYTTPLQTATVFVGLAILLDATLVAGLIEKSYEMFRSPPGTWLPFTMMFLTTYTTGAYLGGRR
jgi:hypothetical protein